MSRKYTLGGGSGKYTIDGVDYDSASYQVQANSRNISLYSLHDNDVYVLRDVPYGNILKGTTAYSSMNDLMRDMRAYANTNKVTVSKSDIDAEYVKEDEAFRFTGTQKIETNKDLDFTNGATILLEMKPESFGGVERVISNSLGFNPASNGFFIVMSTNGVIAIQAVNSSYVVSQSMSSGLNEWVKIAITISASGSVAFYEEGQSLAVASGSTIGIVDSTRPVVLGNLNNNGNYNRPFTGSIRRATIFQSVKSVSDIKKWNDRMLDVSLANYNMDFVGNVEEIKTMGMDLFNISKGLYE